jgi:hypothetical protein
MGGWHVSLFVSVCYLFSGVLSSEQKQLTLLHNAGKTIIQQEG